MIGACASRLPHRRIVIDSPMPPSSSEGRHCRPGGFRDRRCSKHGDRGCRRHRQRLPQGGGADRGELGANRRKMDGPRRARTGARCGRPGSLDDMPTEYGSPIYRGHRPHRGLLRRWSAPPAGSSWARPHEFAAIQSPIPTRNPHNPDHTPAGAPRAAAAVADFMVPLAFGTQTGGSLIRPAAFAGWSATSRPDQPHGMNVTPKAWIPSAC